MPPLQTWLYGSYLTIVEDRGRPIPASGPVPQRALLARAPEAVVKLDHVCFLDLTGKITGVLPGTYQVGGGARAANLRWFHARL